MKKTAFLTLFIGFGSSAIMVMETKKKNMKMMTAYQKKDIYIEDVVTKERDKYEFYR